MVPTRRTLLRLVAVAALAGVLVRICGPSSTDSARASVVASVARRLGARAELVELEWFEARPDGQEMDFEAVARVSASQPGDLHGVRYRVHGRARAGGEHEDVEIRELQLDRVPDVPPEPRP